MRVILLVCFFSMRALASRLLIVGAPCLFLACATVQPPQPPSLDLPKPPSDLRASRKGSHVTLTWTVPRMTTDRQTIRSLGSTRICRGSEHLTECGTPIGTMPSRLPSAKSGQKASDSYTDTLPEQMLSDTLSFTTYAVEVLNPNGRAAGLSNQVRVPLLRTLPPPQDFQPHVTSRGVELSWKSEAPAESAPAPLHYFVRVFRRALGTGEQTTVGELPAAGQQTLTDKNIEWEKTYNYYSETVTVLDQPNKPAIQVEGDNTAEVQVFADDVFPPAVPSGLQAVFSGPGQKPFIDLVWAPVTDIDLAGYNVYRHEEGTAPVKLNASLLKTPAYRDPDVAPGKHYYYSVSAVDLRGNESARSEEATESVP